MSRLEQVMSAAVLFGLTTLGCGESVSYPETAPVTGTVTLDGKPVEGANIMLRPVEGAESYSGRAVSGTDGTFEVMTFFSASHDVAGAVPGKYTVAVTKPGAVTGGPQAHGAEAIEQAKASTPQGRSANAHAGAGGANILPKRYADAQTSGLEIEVKADQENVLKLELKSK